MRPATPSRSWFRRAWVRRLRARPGPTLPAVADRLVTAGHDQEGPACLRPCAIVDLMSSLVRHGLSTDDSDIEPSTRPATPALSNPMSTLIAGAVRVHDGRRHGHHRDRPN